MAYLTVNGEGRLGGDCDLRYTKAGTPVVSFNLATSNPQKAPGGEWTDSPTAWVKVSLYGYQAEELAPQLRKGVKVFCSGDLIQEEWETKAGEKRQQLYLRAKVVAVSGKPQDSKPVDPWANMPAVTDLGADNVPF